MAITVYQTETHLLKSTKITSRKKSSKLQEYWNKQTEKQNIEVKTMKIVK